MQPNDCCAVNNFIGGTQTRQFCDIDDLLEGFVRLMHMPEDFTGPVNLGNHREFTMIELAEAIKALTGSKSELIHKRLPTDNHKQRHPNIRIAREMMGWGPGITLQQGLKPTFV